MVTHLAIRRSHASAPFSGDNVLKVSSVSKRPLSGSGATHGAAGAVGYSSSGAAGALRPSSAKEAQSSLVQVGHGTAWWEHD